MKQLSSIQIRILIGATLSLLGSFGGVSLPVFAQQSTVLEQAQTAMDAGQYADAETLLQSAIQTYPDSAETYYQLALSLHHQFRLGEAIASYRQALELDPSNDLPYVNLGLALIEMKRLDEASTVFRQVLEFPDQEATPVSRHTLAHYNLAIISLRQENLGEAITAVEAALAIEPNFEPAQELLQTLSDSPLPDSNP